MLRVSRMACIRVLLLSGATILLAGCGDPVKEAKTAAELRGQFEMTLTRLEATGEVPGLQHRHVTVDPDSDVDGFAGDDVAIVATGHTAPLLLPDLDTVAHYDQHLTLEGLRLVFERNQNDGRSKLRPAR